MRPVRAPEPLPSQPMLDMHSHLAGIGAGGSGCFICPELRKGWKYPLYLRAFHVTQQELQEQGDALIVDRFVEQLSASRYVDAAVVLALDLVFDRDGRRRDDRTQVYVPNDWLAAQCRRYPHQLYLAASVHPYRPDALQRLEEAAELGAVLIKWLPAIQHMAVDDEKIVPFYKRLAELQLPLLTHVGAERAFAHADHEAGDPEKLRLPLQHGVTVIAAHMASTGSIDGQRQYDRLVPMFAEYPNLYADISSLTQINKLGYLNETLLRDEVLDRLLYGTDMPLPDTPLTSPFYFPLNLTPREMWRLNKGTNAWDRDVLLKQALGVPTAVFERPRTLLLG